MFNGYDALGRKIFDLRRAVFFPIGDIRVRADAKGSTREDDGADIVVEASSADGFLMRLWRAGLFAQDEAGADPDRARPEHECCCQRLAVEQATRGNDLHLIARHRALSAFDHFGDGGDEDGGGDVAGVAAAFATLGADHVGADVEAFLHVFGVPDHVHVEDAGFVEALHDVCGWDADGGDEEFGAGVDDDGYQVVKFAFCVVVAGQLCLLA